MRPFAAARSSFRQSFSLLGLVSAATASVALLAGCPDRPISKVDPIQSGEVSKDVPVSADVDILFVIDNSSSTEDKQTIFAQNFPNFINALFAFPTGVPNVHIGVVTTSVDIGTTTIDGMSAANAGCPSPNTAGDGLLQNTAATTGCNVPTGGARFISDIANPAGGARITNYGTSSATNLASTFSCIAQVGAHGCGFEQPLEAMKRALNGSRTENDGFLRPGAALAIIILTDEDDASIANPAIFALPSASNGGVTDFRAQPMYAYTCKDANGNVTPILGTGTGQTLSNCTVTTGTGSYLKDPSGYYAFLTSIKDPSQIVVALIAGDPQYNNPNDGNATYKALADNSVVTGSLTEGTNTQALALEPSCSATINGNPAIGRPSIRLNDFLANFGDHGLFQTVCQSDYSSALTAIGNLLFTAVSPCLEGDVDVTDIDASNPGTQIDCSVVDVVGLDTATETSTQLPVCKMMADGVTPIAPMSGACWYVALDAVACATTPTMFTLKVDRTTTAPEGTNTQISCATNSN